MNRLKKWGQRIGTAAVPTMWSALAWAQQQPGGGGGGGSDVTTTTTTTSETWYVNPWIWAAVGIGIFLIVVIALTNRGRRV